VSSIPFFLINISLTFISYLTLYSLILVFFVLTYLAAMLFYYVGTQRASRSINAKLVDSVLGSTLRSVRVAGLGFHTDIPCSAGLTKLLRRVSSPDAHKTSRLLMAVLPGRSRV
jgi:hypothetical protein